VIRLKNREFDSLFICGSEEHRKEIITAFKSSDMASRAKVVRDIPLSVKSVDLKTLGQLKEAIPNISEYIAEDSIYNEKKYQKRVEDFLATETESIDFGVENVLNAIAATNTSLLVINESNKAVVTAQMIQDFGLDKSYIGERDEMSLVELLLEYALDQNVELAIIQSGHVQGFLEQFGGLYVVHKF
jgi:peptide subunit release factor 1 (eRF1)